MKQIVFKDSSESFKLFSGKELTLDKFNQFVKENFPKFKKFKLFFFDEQSDLLTLSSQEDVNVMLEMNSDKGIIGIDVILDVSELRGEEDMEQQIERLIERKKREQREKREKRNKSNSSEKDRRQWERRQEQLSRLSKPKRTVDEKKVHKFDKLYKLLRKDIQAIVAEEMEVKMQTMMHELESKLKGEVPKAKSVENIVHEDIACEVCKIKPIVGVRYKCQQCIRFNMCSKCEDSYEHVHNLTKIKKLPEPKQSKVKPEGVPLDKLMKKMINFVEYCSLNPREGKHAGPFRPGSMPMGPMEGPPFPFGRGGPRGWPHPPPHHFRPWGRHGCHGPPPPYPHPEPAQEIPPVPEQKSEKKQEQQKPQLSEERINKLCRKMARRLGKNPEDYREFVVTHPTLTKASELVIMYQVGERVSVNNSVENLRKLCLYFQKDEQEFKDFVNEHRKLTFEELLVRLKQEGKYDFDPKDQKRMKLMKKKSKNEKKMVKRYKLIEKQVEAKEFEKLRSEEMDAVLAEQWDNDMDFGEIVVGDLESMPSSEQPLPEIQIEAEIKPVTEKEEKEEKEGKEGKEENADEDEQEEEGKGSKEEILDKEELERKFKSDLEKKFREDLEKQKLLIEKSRIFEEMKEIFGDEKEQQLFKFVDTNFSQGQERIIDMWIKDQYNKMPNQ